MISAQQSQGHDAENLGLADDAPRRLADRCLESVDRAGADVAEHHPHGAQHELHEPAARCVRAGSRPRVRRRRLHDHRL